MADPKSIARKSSLNPNSPFYVDEEEGGKTTGAIAVVECIRLARELKDHSRLPLSCQEYIDNHAVLKRAFEGMSGDQIAHAVEVRERAKKGKQGLTHAQLQRRWTSRENPLRKKKTGQN